MSVVDILSPHYDDAVLSAWHKVEEPDTRVITVFGGRPGPSSNGIWDKFSTSKDGFETAELRRLENETALASTATIAINLDYLDRQYQPFKSRRIEDIADEIEDIATEDTTYLAPVGVGSLFRMHPDHIATRKVGIELMERGQEVLFYIDIPYLLPAHDLSEWPARIPLRKVERAIGQPVSISAHELTSDEQQSKREALSHFATQMPMVNKLAFGALRSADAYKWEVVVKPN